ncbi:hypothetical protein JBW_01088 [Pelosinus fermentans JBW45]|uniref:Uncharacterized protein n=1 Tax=Pelosinus fermentans JBW45 TaxID=1192197 RepID=I8U0R8_9FIRM|nr:hypothetical protein JBW_01088 [Pelosinus fermentans JBW45]
MQKGKSYPEEWSRYLCLSLRDYFRNLMRLPKKMIDNIVRVYSINFPEKGVFEFSVERIRVYQRAWVGELSERSYSLTY